MRLIEASDLKAQYYQRVSRYLGEHDPNDLLAQSSALLREICSRSGPQRRAFLRTRLTAMLVPVVPDADVEFVDSVIDECLATGDLVMVRDGSALLVALSPPSWVRRASGSVFLVGDFPEVPAPSIAGQTARGAFRVVPGRPTDEFLANTGRANLPGEVWLIHPRVLDAENVIALLDTALQKAPRAGAATVDVIFDATKPDGYFRGRLVVPRRQSGRYLARRKRTWGAPTWSYCQLEGGQIETFIDLPRLDHRFSGRDEWYWAMAAVVKIGRAQSSVRAHAGSTTTALSFRSPIPSWAERRLFATGSRRTSADKGALMTFDIPNAEASEEVSFLETALWLDVVKEWS